MDWIVDDTRLFNNQCESLQSDEVSRTKLGMSTPLDEVALLIQTLFVDVHCYLFSHFFLLVCIVFSLSL